MASSVVAESLADTKISADYSVAEESVEAWEEESQEESEEGEEDSEEERTGSSEEEGRSTFWIEFETQAEAHDAVARFGGVELAGLPMHVKCSKTHERCVYVSNMPLSVTAEMVAGTFNQIGKVEEVVRCDSEDITGSDVSSED